MGYSLMLSCKKRWDDRPIPMDFANTPMSP
jgi:hypothetical protein